MRRSMGTARVAQLGVAAALLLALLAARAAPLPVASSVSSSSSPSSSFSSTSSAPCISADLHKVIRGNMGLLQFNVDRVLQAYKGMADVEISEHEAVLSAAEPCVRRAEAVPSPSHLSGAFALYGALVATLCERAHLPDGSEVRAICRAVVALLEDTPFLPPRSGEEQGDVEAVTTPAAAEVTTVVGRKEGEQQQQTEKKTVKAQSGGESANDSVVVATEAPGVENRTETAAAWVAGTSVASTAPRLNNLRGEQYTEAGIADVRNVTATSEEEEQWRRTNHHQQQRRRPQEDDKHSEAEKHQKEVDKEVDERSQSRWPCLPSHVKHATSLHGSSDSRIVMFALFQRFQQFLTQVSKRLNVCRP
ncbi:uncharacterized protein LOC116940036 isoform X2 [Petromyzon marinus]|uniref:Uncharacterized protein LOC116940036 isoform X1 n=2 Tax=Petromyzon marinus TaxID=7757 RepID=A0AAJ7STA9_PETMA|nr:uncharacterized protein LOC116940036 isoform X1 [Petromyzon marinus]